MPAAWSRWPRRSHNLIRISPRFLPGVLLRFDPYEIEEIAGAESLWLSAIAFSSRLADG